MLFASKLQWLSFLAFAFDMDAIFKCQDELMVRDTAILYTCNNSIFRLNMEKKSKRLGEKNQASVRRFIFNMHSSGEGWPIGSRVSLVAQIHDWFQCPDHGPQASNSASKAEKYTDLSSTRSVYPKSNPERH